MDAPKPEPNQKRRQHKNENFPGPQRKSQRLLDKNKQPVKITDLDDDCLEKIFGHLDLSGLFNVAVANEWLRPAAGVIYKRKFGKKTVWIRKRNTSVTDPFECIDRIIVVNLKMCLQYLRCLGPSISSLTIVYCDWNKKQCDHIHQYMGEYCAASLVSIQFWSNSAGLPIKHFDKSFVNVRTVTAYNSDFGNQFSLFPQWFPNMRKLDLSFVRIGRCSMNTPFNHLENLNIQIGNGKDYYSITKAAHFLRLCPQLHSLKINVFHSKAFTLNELSNVIKNNPNICHLEVNTTPFETRVFLSDVQQLANEHPPLIELYLDGYKFTAEAAISMVRQLNSLKKFCFEIGDRSEYDRILSHLDSKWQPTLHEMYRNHRVELQC